MAILNVSKESFFKNSVRTTTQDIRDAVAGMEQDGADIIDIGGMSTAPNLKTLVSEKTESQRITRAIKIIQNVSNLPISIDTCRAGVARDALDLGVRILNDISGLKYDPQMQQTISLYDPSVILCAFGRLTACRDQVDRTRSLLKQSILLAKNAGIKPENIVLDPSIGFFRRHGDGPFFTRINADWTRRDVQIIKNLRKIKQKYPLLVSVSNKSFIGNILDIENPAKRVIGSVTAEAICVLNGADIIRTHNVEQTIQAVRISEAVLKSR